MLIRHVRWLFDYHALSYERWRSISLNRAIRGKQRTTGGGPREFLYRPTHGNQLTIEAYLGVITIAHSWKFKGADSRYGNELQKFSWS
jgi:hypothetical protein